MGNLRAQIDLMGECNPGSKISIADFEKVVCSQCMNAKCHRSRFSDSATQEKIQRHERLLEYVDPHEAEASPLSEYPDEVVNRADPDTTVEPSEKLGEAVEDLTALRTEQERPADPWAAPTVASMHKEWDNPEQDPWSVDYAGAIDKKVGRNATIRIPGRRKK